MENKKWKWYENAIVYMFTAFGLTLVGEIIGVFVVYVPALVILGFETGLEMIVSGGKAAATKDFSPFGSTLILYFSTIGTWIVCLLCFLRKKNRPLFRCFTKYCSGNNFKKFLLGLLIGGGMNGACILAAYLNGNITMSFDSFRPLPLLAVLLAVFIQSSSEEILCRGYLYQKLNRRYNPVVAVLGSSLFFAALHLGNPGVGVVAVLDLILSGLLFALMVYYMDSIWCAFAAHTAWNYTQNIIFGLPNSGLTVDFSIFKLNAGATDGFFYNTAFGVEGSWFAVLVEAAVIVVIWQWGRRKGKKPTDIWKEETIDAGKQVEYNNGR